MTRPAALALLLACAPAPRPPPPALTPAQLAVLDRAPLALERLSVAAQFDAADVRLATARSRAERRIACAAHLVARQDLRSRP